MDKNLVLEKKKQVNPKIVEYVESEIFPQYLKFVGGHGLEHIQDVIERSFQFGATVPEINFDMVYVIAAYHDIGRKIDNDTHEIQSAKLFLEDETICKFFTSAQQKTIAEAIEDHRASSKSEPRSVYGKIVSSADRGFSVEDSLRRSTSYNRSLHPQFSRAEVIEDARFHLRKKYAPGGYAARKMYFDDPLFTEYMQEIERVTASAEAFEKALEEFGITVV